MTGTQDPPPIGPDGASLLLADLALIAGILSEITTAWRRAKAYLPGLPLGLPAQLQDTARQLASDVQILADTGTPRLPARPGSVADRFSVLTRDIASAQAITRGPGLPDVADGKLWESLSAPLHRVETQLAAFGPPLVAAGGIAPGL